MTLQPQQPDAAPPWAWSAAVEHPVFFVPDRVRAAVVAAARTRKARLVSLGISVAILAAFYVFFRDQLGDLTWPILVVSLSLPLATLASALLKERAARREASAAGEGLALGVARAGLLTREGWLGWHEVGSLRAMHRRLGRGDELVVTARDGRVARVPLASLSDVPATLDGAVRALSGGRCRIDFARLDA